MKLLFSLSLNAALLAYVAFVTAVCFLRYYLLLIKKQTKQKQKRRKYEKTNQKRVHAR